MKHTIVFPIMDTTGSSTYTFCSSVKCGEDVCEYGGDVSV